MQVKNRANHRKPAGRKSVVKPTRKASPTTRQSRRTGRREKHAAGIPMSVMRYAVKLIDPPAIADEPDEKPF